MKKKTLNLNDIVSDSEFSFWETVARKHMPLAESGDSDPMQSFRFQSAMEEAIKSWWYCNGAEHYNLKDGDEILKMSDD
mgnify:FL=1|tara:strand:+ start:274 stop:510 length:237 start_codon:yes stop_codon:yes gene_type:complete